MNDKCFCHFNGYAVKDATARREIETIKEEYATKTYVDGITPTVDLTEYATKEYVEETITNIEIPESDYIKPVVLYNNIEGSNEDIILNDSAANYEYIEIYYKDNVNSDHGCEKFYNINGKECVLDLVKTWFGSDSQMHCEIRSTCINVNNTSITPVEQGFLAINNTTISSHSDVNRIYITRVVGYK